LENTSIKYLLASSTKEGLIKHVKKNPLSFNEILSLSLTKEKPHSSRAAWLLSHAIEKDDERLGNHISTILDTIKSTKGGQRRDLLAVLYKVGVEEQYESILFDVCLQIWSEINEIPSTRYLAIKHIASFLVRYPELESEVDHLMEDEYMDTLSEGIKRSVFKLIGKK